MTKLLNDKFIYKNYEFSYDYYKKLVNKYMENDSREINFQNRVVVQFLDKLFIDTKAYRLLMFRCNIRIKIVKYMILPITHHKKRVLHRQIC